MLFRCRSFFLAKVVLPAGFLSKEFHVCGALRGHQAAVAANVLGRKDVMLIQVIGSLQGSHWQTPLGRTNMGLLPRKGTPPPPNKSTYSPRPKWISCKVNLYSNYHSLTSLMVPSLTTIHRIWPLPMRFPVCLSRPVNPPTPFRWAAETPAQQLSQTLFGGFMGLDGGRESWGARLLGGLSHERKNPQNEGQANPTKITY